MGWVSGFLILLGSGLGFCDFFSGQSEKISGSLRVKEIQVRVDLGSKNTCSKIGSKYLMYLGNSQVKVFANILCKMVRKSGENTLQNAPF